MFLSSVLAVIDSIRVVVVIIYRYSLSLSLSLSLSFSPSLFSFSQCRSESSRSEDISSCEGEEEEEDSLSLSPSSSFSCPRPAHCGPQLDDTTQGSLPLDRDHFLSASPAHWSVEEVCRFISSLQGEFFNLRLVDGSQASFARCIVHKRNCQLCDVPAGLYWSCYI